MINFGILGRVTASQGDWVASLARQQQHLLSVLVLAGGSPVDRPSLETALWDEQLHSPEGGVKRVVSELRARLEPAFRGVGDPIPGASDTYRLRIASDQADVLRFRAKSAEARRATGPRSTELMRAALEEWGPEATGLYGGRPLGGLPGHWADARRTALRLEHRDAVIHCLEQDLRDERYDRLVRECERLADEPDTLHDSDFVHLWVTAAHNTGLPGRADQILRLAEDSVRRHLQRPLDGRLRELAERIRTDSTSTRGRAMIDRGRKREGTDGNSDGTVVFNNYDDTAVGVQTAQASGSFTVNMPAKDVSVKVQGEEEPEA
ncbi:BTAD domain-containing putative transcriptional regulator [Actinomadura syzygii]|uniref:Bacterial transcriptional activator domain-containing protein n=1 Tax=Actinomadura syzygii TaxID=1427538 RepID=A0A5D0U851_9ACTN|nr:BTAD domain-containing putative transcriptional regulator [Actinomadura syzygii]TYC13855.1 hypothetical protein FXF65_19585 [Actinomadura syzygii]